MKKGSKKLIYKKQKRDKAVSVTTLCLSWFFSLLFLCLIGFIIFASIPGFEEFGIKNILFTGDFNLAAGEASIWLPLCVTIITAGFAVIVAAPLGVKTAIFIKFRMPKKTQKSVRIAIELLADIPSVIFGLFACQALGTIVQHVFGLSSAYNLLTASLMLTFMILPTIVSLSLNSLDSVDSSLISAAMVLGNTKTRAIYKVYKREAKAGMTVAIIIAMARAIGETMAVSMILQSQGYNSTFDNGFFSIIDSGLRSLGALISANMFAESGGPALQGLLFAFGIFLFLFVMILNGIAMKMTKKKQRSKYEWWNKMEIKVHNFIAFIPTQITLLFNKIFSNSNNQLTVNNLETCSAFYKQRVQNDKFLSTGYSYYKQFWEWVSIITTITFLVWILMNIFINGIAAIGTGSSTIFSLQKGSTGQAIINTILIIIVCVGIGLPFALAIAIYLSEFAKESKGKSVLLFFIDSLGATPSILFGMFGMIFFIQTLGLSAGGTAGKSLIAGAFTLIIVILPTFIRTIQQALQGIPQEIRTNSYALGAGKWETINKIVLPAAFQSITTAVVLVIGRILAETAPLYLTAGLDSSSHISLDSPGQTLTTRIYAQIYNQNYTEATKIMYECALVTMVLVLAIIIIVHIAIPKYFDWKKKRAQKVPIISSEPSKNKQKTSKKKQTKNITNQANINNFIINANRKTNYQRYYYG